MYLVFFFFFQAEDGIRDKLVTGVQTCALPISPARPEGGGKRSKKPSEAQRLPSHLRLNTHRHRQAHQATRLRPTRLIRRSEERRVGKECRSRRSAEHCKTKR